MDNNKETEIGKKIEKNNKEQFINYLAFLIKKYKDKIKK